MRRLQRAIERSGVGVHGGAPGAVMLCPVPWGTGVVVRHRGHTAPVHVAQAEAPGGATVLRVGPHRVATPEHLLAAIVGLGVTDVALDVQGPEVPILDGSAAPWVAAIREAGVEEGPPGPERRVVQEVHVRAHGGEAWLRPHPGLRVSVEVAWPALTGAFSADLPDDLPHVAPARTFVFSADVERLRAAGRGRGATAENTVVWGRTTSLRFPDEPVRHKLLDALGDLALAGAPVRGHLHVVRGSHALHHAVIRAWLKESP